ncbi:MAG: GTPase Era [Desulfovibrionaceae bacterium]|nr:GTPase Era [Desulfovibrionaceae bacterium]
MDKQNHCGRVALIGPPNAGKSTLLNALLGQKITIVTPKPQTTRNQIVGILSEGDDQAIFLDTPGLTEQHGRLSKTMTQAIWSTLREADILVLVIDGNLYVRNQELLETDLGPLIKALSVDERSMVLVVNKIDLFADKNLMLPLFVKLNEIWPKAEIFPLSALAKDGLDELRKLILKKLPVGEFEFPKDQVSTQPVRFMVAEIIREKLFLYLRQEVPYGVAVDIEAWDEGAEGEQTIIHALIYVAKAAYKGMIIGHGGATLKKIGSEARAEIQELLEQKVHLELWVKVRDHWTEDPAFLRDIGLLTEGG